MRLNNLADMARLSCLVAFLLSCARFATAQTSETETTQDCKVFFKGEELTFDACRTSIGDTVSVYWTKTNESITTLFSAPSQGYVAWSWGTAQMVPSSAAVAYIDSDSQEAVVRNYAMRAKSETGVSQADGDRIFDTDGEYSGGVLTGMYTRAVDATIRDGLTDCIWALGPSTGAALRYHTSSGIASLDVQSTSATGSETAGVPLARVWKIHGALMSIAWLVLAPLGILCMRYLKRFKPVAFQGHRALFAVVFVITLVSFILGVINANRTKTAHLVIGSVVMGLAVVQVLCGVLRPRQESSFKCVAYLVHRMTGRLTWTLAAINIFVGLSLANAVAGLYVAAGLAIGLFFCLGAVFEFFLKENFPTSREDVEKKSQCPE